MAPQRWRAPAKVNLTLHVRGRRADGYHELSSLVAFAGACDWLEFEPGFPLSLDVRGPTAASVGPIESNLVLAAANALVARAPGLRLGKFRLFKALPAAAGLGGGSSDAAAALRALAHANALADDDPRLLDAARAVGADVPVCLFPRARRMEGMGERLGRPLALAPTPAVLVNPRVETPTPRIFAGLGLAPGQSHRREAEADGSRDLFAAILAGRNDLQASATAFAPVIGETIARLDECAGARLTRMSGSGATCFAIFHDRRAAVEAAARLRRERPDWWIRATLLR